jgi:general stress protein 26
MKRTELPPSLRQLLEDVPYVTLATVCPTGKPWNTPVFGCFDDELNLYWASWPKNQHSRNIERNRHVFVVAFRSDAPEGEGFGIYLEMKAEKLSDAKDIAAARKIYTSSFGENFDHEPFIGDCPRRLYKAVPQRVWSNSDAYIKGAFVDIRRQVTPASKS